ncbi:MAG: class I SAM-dependent methyltransferase [Caulobacteraceae bacterium]|nr:class I SAM-dependent methyltransferase [Caulobacteraceae bacterium]
MSASEFVSDAVRAYVQAHGAREHPVLARCRSETNAMGDIARMQISPEQGGFMQVMARAIRARHVLEVGVFTGYSSTAVALALKDMHGADCELIACDIAEAFVARARGYWAEAGVADLIQTRIGPALDSLDGLIDDGRAGQFDLMFIDADKSGYDAYYERGLTLLRAGGLMLIDNMLWSGRVTDPDESDADTTALRALAAKIAEDDRVDMTLATVGDGVSMVVKR